MTAEALTICFAGFSVVRTASALSVLFGDR
jgi:hypothetical protein